MRCILIWYKSLVILISKKFECTLLQIGTFYKKWTFHINSSCKKGRRFWKSCVPKLLVKYTKTSMMGLFYIAAVLQFNENIINCLQVLEGILVRPLPNCKIYFQWEFGFGYLGSEFSILTGSVLYLQQRMC